LLDEMFCEVIDMRPCAFMDSFTAFTSASIENGSFQIDCSSLHPYGPLIRWDMEGTSTIFDLLEAMDRKEKEPAQREEMEREKLRLLALLRAGKE
jgi:hypothetical protein